MLTYKAAKAAAKFEGVKDKKDEGMEPTPEKITKINEDS